MLFHKLRRGLAAVAVSGVLALSSFGAFMPAAEALSAGSVIGAAIGGAISYSQANHIIKKYNKTEEGRRELFRSLQAKYGVNGDARLKARVDAIMGNLARGIATIDPTVNDPRYNYFINNEDSFNAFCTLGHNMSINRGLFDVLTNDDEIAVVLAHEMGHGQKDHPAKGVKRSILPGILADAVGNIAGVLAANVWNSQGITKPMEWEADNLAFEYITHTPYNPGATAAVWQRIMEKSNGKANSIAQFLSGGSDHPSDKARRDNYLKKLAAYSNKHAELVNGTVKVNGKDFVTPAPTADMSMEERACFVLGNLATAYHRRLNTQGVTVSGNVVMMGSQPIIAVVDGDESARVLAERLESIR